MSISIRSSNLLSQQTLEPSHAETENLSTATSAALASNHLDAVALNPQPLPPKASVLDALRSRFDAVALNPQPLPPKEPEPLANEPRLNVVARLLRGQS